MTHLNVIGCEDYGVRLDHFDITRESRRVWKRFNQLRKRYPVLVDGFELVAKGNWTEITPPTTRGIQREYGLWSVVRRFPITDAGPKSDPMWILYSNQASEIFSSSRPSQQADSLAGK